MLISGLHMQGRTGARATENTHTHTECVLGMYEWTLHSLNQSLHEISYTILLFNCCSNIQEQSESLCPLSIDTAELKLSQCLRVTNQTCWVVLPLTMLL